MPCFKQKDQKPHYYDAKLSASENKSKVIQYTNILFANTT